MNSKQFCESGLKVVEIEAKAIAGLKSQIGSDFARACEQLFYCQGHIVVIGVGKSGHVGKKIAATLASTGSRAFFVHAAEANHGDLGMIDPSKDIVLALSHSGETEEITSLLPTLTLLKIPLIVITGNPSSTLAKKADVTLLIPIQEEACSLGLAPTASSTSALVMGDAIAVALHNARGFSRDDFAKVHPKGWLGRQLLLKVADVMHQGTAVPQVTSNTSVLHGLLELSRKRQGVLLIINDTELQGVFTDQELKQVIGRQINLVNTTMGTVMTTQYQTTYPDQLAMDALQLMEAKKINTLVVLAKQKRPVGIIHLHDILSQGIHRGMKQ